MLKLRRVTIPSYLDKTRVRTSFDFISFSSYEVEVSLNRYLPNSAIVGADRRALSPRFRASCFYRILDYLGNTIQARRC